MGVNKQGHLIYVVGASGAGKDTVLNVVRSNEYCPDIVVVHRYITRPSHVGNESHVSLNNEEFLLRQQQGLFALDWQAHETHYGIGIEINHSLSEGLTVIINGSREYFPEAIKRYPQMKLVWIMVDSDVLQQRLIKRGRDTLPDIRKRVERNNTLEKIKPLDCFSLDNSGEIESTVTQFVEIINSLDTTLVPQ